MKHREPVGMGKGHAFIFARGMSKPCWICYDAFNRSYVPTTNPDDDSLEYLVEIGIDGKTRDVREAYQKKRTIKQGELSECLKNLD